MGGKQTLEDYDTEDRLAEEEQAWKEGWESLAAKELHEGLDRFIENGGFDGDPDNPADNLALNGDNK